jgi:retinol dehydrogenase-12
MNAYAVSPGIVFTNLGRHVSKKFLSKLLIAVFYPLIWYLMKTPRQGAERVIYCAIAPNLKQTTGFYFRDCKQLKLTPNANNETDAKRLWKISEKFVERYL